MKKFTYLVIATAALSMVACTGGNKAGYTITGTVEGASDGDTVYLQEANGRNLTKLDTAVITKGTFTFEGTQDSVVSRYVTCEVNGEPLMIDFFLENGKINVALTKDNDAVTGTPNNDAYQEIRAQINDISKKMNAIYEAMGNTSLSDEQKEAKQKEGAQLNKVERQQQYTPSKVYVRKQREQQHHYKIDSKANQCTNCRCNHHDVVGKMNLTKQVATIDNRSKTHRSGFLHELPSTNAHQQHHRIRGSTVRHAQELGEHSIHHTKQHQRLQNRPANTEE